MFATINGAAVLAALFGVELYLSFVQDVPPAAEERAPKSIAAELRSAGVRAYPHICPAMLAGARLFGSDGSPLLPLGGLSDNLLVSLDGNDVVTRHSDEYGFNNPSGQWHAGALKVMAIGDSFTFGADVPFGHSFVDLVRSNVGSVVNLECGGNGPLAELAALSEYGPLVRPKTVVWFYYEGNDLTKDLRRELRSPVLLRYLEGGATQRLAGRQVEINKSIIAFLKVKLATADRSQRRQMRVRQWLCGTFSALRNYAAR